jgi:putative holliday junction resolvase
MIEPIPSQNLLAIDYGRRRVGIAGNARGSSIAFGITTLVIKGLNDLWEQLEPILKERKIDRIILGLPITLADNAGPIVEDIFYLRNCLLERGYSIDLVDEALSSSDASKLLAFRGRKTKKTDVDRTAAAVFLQAYLNGTLLPLTPKEIEKYQTVS